jgi:phosphoglycolate phosphatase
MSYRVLLFDIDGTLVATAGAGRLALERAFAELAQVANALEQVILDGATDVAIVREALVRAGREANPALIDRLLARYTALLPTYLAAAESYRLLDGVAEILEGLTRAGRVFGLCTGNIVEGARHKLARGGIWRHFEGGFLGGFGSDAEPREDIARMALQRAAAHLGGALDPREALVIGDTPRDVRAAQMVGVPVLAVASGRHGVAELRATGATHVVPSLQAPEALAIIGL